MSGPIVRKYGFPNFEKIFGEREIKHGVEDEAPAPDPSATDAGRPKGETPAANRPKGDPTRPA